MSDNFADRLYQRVRQCGTPTCVGLDPDWARLPATVRERYPTAERGDPAAAADAFVEFGRGVIAAVAPLVPVMKINSAFFEVFGGRGVDAYFELVRAAKAAGLLVIGDVKRADIGHSTAAYARGQLAEGGLAASASAPTSSFAAGFPADREAGPACVPAGRYTARPDAVTVNPYLGLDGIKPFMEVCRDEGKGLFVLVQTSNEAAREVQDVRLESGDTLAAHVGRLVNAWAGAPGLMGACGYSAVGAVVSPRDVAGADILRSILARCTFLVPGYGAQGQSAQQVAHCFKKGGTGAIVNSSRGVIFAYEDERYAASLRTPWQSCVEAACRDFIADLNRVLTSRRTG
ncbi:MAG: orotidine-5'-phosphate decarboxylase [Planctomycetota bacterium]